MKDEKSSSSTFKKSFPMWFLFLWWAYQTTVFHRAMRPISEKESNNKKMWLPAICMSTYIPNMKSKKLRSAMYVKWNYVNILFSTHDFDKLPLLTFEYISNNIWKKGNVEPLLFMFVLKRKREKNGSSLRSTKLVGLFLHTQIYL